MLRTAPKQYSIYLIGLVSILFVLSIAIAFLNYNSETGADPEIVQRQTIITGYPSNTVFPIPTEITPTQIQTLSPAPTVSAQIDENEGNYISVYVTYYGWNDNDPPGTAIAYPSTRYGQTLHSEASGEGSFDNPITFASDPSIFPIGTKLYVPYINKYIVMEDLCATCSGNHIDIWMQSKGAFESELYECQRHWTRSTIQVEFDPPPGRQVEYTPLFNQNTGQCLQ